MHVRDYTTPLGDITRCSLWECRDFAWNPKQGARIFKKVVKRSLARAQYVKVPIWFWEDIHANGMVIRPGLYLVEVSGQYRLYCSDLQSRAAFLKGIVDCFGSREG